MLVSVDLQEAFLFFFFLNWNLIGKFYFRDQCKTDSYRLRYSVRGQSWRFSRSGVQARGEGCPRLLPPLSRSLSTSCSLITLLQPCPQQDPGAGPHQNFWRWSGAERVPPRPYTNITADSNKPARTWGGLTLKPWGLGQGPSKAWFLHAVFFLIKRKTPPNLGPLLCTPIGIFLWPNWQLVKTVTNPCSASQLTVENAVQFTRGEA